MRKPISKEFYLTSTQSEVASRSLGVLGAGAAWLAPLPKGRDTSRVNQNISWPSAVVLSVLLGVLGALVWKGAIPSQVLSASVGAVLGYIVPRAASAMVAGKKAKVVATAPAVVSSSEAKKDQVS